MDNPKVKTKECRYCKRKFVPYSTLDPACSLACFINLGRFKKKKTSRRDSRKTKRVKRVYTLKCALHELFDEHDYLHSIEGHHIIYLSQKGPDADWNIIPLCRNCHSLVHKKKAYWQKRLLIIRGGTDWFNNIPNIDQYYALPLLMQPKWLRIAESLNK